MCYVPEKTAKSFATNTLCSAYRDFHSREEWWCGVSVQRTKRIVSPVNGPIKEVRSCGKGLTQLKTFNEVVKKVFVKMRKRNFPSGISKELKAKRAVTLTCVKRC